MHLIIRSSSSTITSAFLHSINTFDDEQSDAAEFNNCAFGARINEKWIFVVNGLVILVKWAMRKCCDGIAEYGRL